MKSRLIHLKVTLALLISFIAFSSIAQQSLDTLLEQYNTRSISYISVEEARMLQLQGDVILLDTREMNEYEVSHIEGSQWVGYNNFSVEEVTQQIENKDTPLIVYCSLGIRSEEIGEKLEKAGFTDIKNVYGGIFEWKNKELPVVNVKDVETDSVHIFSKAWGKWLTNGIKTTRNE